MSDIWAVPVTYWYHDGVVIVQAESADEAVRQARESFNAVYATQDASRWVNDPERTELPYFFEGTDH